MPLTRLSQPIQIIPGPQQPSPSLFRSLIQGLPATESVVRGNRKLSLSPRAQHPGPTHPRCCTSTAHVVPTSP